MSPLAALHRVRRSASIVGAVVVAVVVIGPLSMWSADQDVAGGSKPESPSSGVAVPDAPASSDPAAVDAAPVPDLATHGALLSDAPPAPAPPVGITLPTLGVAALVEAVGVDPSGELAVPPSATMAAWYRGGPTPTATSGSSVIAAHVDYHGDQGVFFRLSDLRPGDPVLVTSADGTSSRFTVASTTSYGKADLPTAEIFRRTGDPVLTLITCGGEFRREQRSYADNVVVRATPVLG